MPKREKLLAEIEGENKYGVLLIAQLDGVPETIQLIVATTQYDETAGGLRDQSRYVIRAVGVQEHSISVGIFDNLRFVGDHPLLHQYNATPVGLFFRGQPDNKNELVLDIFQAYASTFGLWRHIPQYLNVSKPLVDLVSGGGDLLGEMPQPLAERLAKVLEHHGLEHKIIEAQHEGPAYKLLLLDESYVVALNFSVEELGKV